jgi:glutathione synthase/RimK-type ligase-like ATP-grasp enzyme
MSALLWGIAEDSPLAAVHAALVRRGAPFAFLDQRRAEQTAVALRTNGSVGGSVACGATFVDLGTVRSMYLRPYDPRKLPGYGSGAAAAGEALTAFAETTGARVVNRPSANASNGSKPFQSTLIRAAGFDVPETLVTTDPDLVVPFWERHGAIVYKSVSGVRSIVSQFTPAHRERIERVAYCPTQFQQYIPGTDVRVHVVGDDVFASSIVSDGDDYRYAGMHDGVVEVSAFELPSSVAERAVRVTAALGLVVSGVDLRRAPDGRWYCFEVNPSPGFTYYESRTAQPIADAIASLLCGAPAG